METNISVQFLSEPGEKGKSKKGENQYDVIAAQNGTYALGFPQALIKRKLSLARLAAKAGRGPKEEK